VIWACEIFVGYEQLALRRSCGNGKLPDAFAGVGVVSQVSPPAPPELLLPPLLLEDPLLPPLLLELLLAPLPLDDPLPPLDDELPEELPLPLELEPPSEPPLSGPAVVEDAQPRKKNPIEREESV
jgi:hypothetical protein